MKTVIYAVTTFIMMSSPVTLCHRNNIYSDKNLTIQKMTDLRTCFTIAWNELFGIIPDKELQKFLPKICTRPDWESQIFLLKVKNDLGGLSRSTRGTSTSRKQKQMCALPCQRLPFLIDQKTLLKWLGFDSRRHRIITESHKMIDIGSCSGNCRSFNRRRSLIGTYLINSCTAVEYDEIQIQDKHTGKITNQSNAIVKHCQCGQTVFCNY